MKQVESKFSKKGNRLIFLAIITLLAFLVSCFYLLISNYPDTGFLVAAFSVLILAGFLWIVHRELYQKMIFMRLDEREVTITRYAGLFFTQKFFWSEVESWEVKTVESESGDLSEIFKFKSNNKTIAILSEFYHSNYFELKSMVMELIRQKKKMKG